MTSGLSDAFTATLSRIKGQPGALARYGISALMWISLAERPLLIEELCHALAVEVEPPNFDPEMVPTIETVVASCMGLVTIDHASSTVRLVHATLKEYLCSHQDSVFQDPHATIAEVCLSYLSLQSVREILPNLQTIPHGFPLLSYASCHWGAHAQKDLTVRVRQLALGILDYIQHVVANISFSFEEDIWYWGRDSAGWSGLHYVAYFGLNEISERLLAMGQGDINQGGRRGRTPLHLAAGRGNEGVVKTLLTCADVNPIARNFHKETPLHVASLNGHEGVVRILLRHVNVNPNLTDDDGCTPLFRASANCHEGVVKILLSHADVNPDLTGWRGRTPLSIASCLGYGEVVKILLSHADVNLNSVDRNGETPLLHASLHDHEGVVRILLSRPDLSPNLADYCGETPLFQACARDSGEVVMALLSRADVNPNLANNRGKTPLSIAAENGNEGVVMILLSHPDINPNLANEDGQTALSRAVRNGHEGVVRMLKFRTNASPGLGHW